MVEQAEIRCLNTDLSFTKSFKKNCSRLVRYIVINKRGYVRVLYYYGTFIKLEYKV